MMEAARTSETSVDNYFTRQYITEDKPELHTRNRENLKSHTCVSLNNRNLFKFYKIQKIVKLEKKYSFITTIH
jgi:hypothetical protein